MFYKYLSKYFINIFVLLIQQIIKIYLKYRKNIYRKYYNKKLIK